MPLSLAVGAGAGAGGIDFFPPLPRDPRARSREFATGDEISATTTERRTQRAYAGASGTYALIREIASISGMHGTCARPV